MAANTSGATQLDMLMDDRATYALIKAYPNIYNSIVRIPFWTAQSWVSMKMTSS